MKELFSVNRAGHMMSEPRSLSDLGEALHHERRETHAHYDGTTNQNAAAVNLITLSVKFAESVPHAPVEHSASDLNRRYQAAAIRYHEGMARALDALKVMQDVAEKAALQHETAAAMLKQQRTAGDLARRSLRR